MPITEDRKIPQKIKGNLGFNGRSFKTAVRNILLDIINSRSNDNNFLWKK